MIDMEDCLSVSHRQTHRQIHVFRIDATPEDQFPSRRATVSPAASEAKYGHRVVFNSPHVRHVSFAGALVAIITLTPQDVGVCQL